MSGFDRIEQGEVAKIFKDTIFLERELESIKIELALKPDFNFMDSFKMIDFQNKGSISGQDLIKALKEVIGFETVSLDDIYLLFRRYDNGRSGKIGFSDYCRIVTPVSKEYA